MNTSASGKGNGGTTALHNFHPTNSSIIQSQQHQHSGKVHANMRSNIRSKIIHNYRQHNNNNPVLMWEK